MSDITALIIKVLDVIFMWLFKDVSANDMTIYSFVFFGATWIAGIVMIGAMFTCKENARGDSQKVN